MQRDVMWAALGCPALEHLRLSVDEDGVVADGVIVGVREGDPLRVRYEVRCDAGWRVRSVRVATLDHGGPEIDLLSDGEGAWTTRDGEAVPGLDGCIDVDISATPFTNTLPIRRLGLAPGESRELPVAYVEVDELRYRSEPQRYTRLGVRVDGGLYRFEALDGDFTADLPLDEDGLVIDYPGLFERVYPV